MPDPLLGDSDARPIGPYSPGAEVAERLADLCLSVFGTVNATAEQRDALADSLLAHATRWINDEFDLGMPDG